MRSHGIVRALSLAIAATSLSACATSHAVRWTYQMPSIWDAPEPYEENVAMRAIVGAPVIIGSAAFDVVTWPIQLIFGVWPMWGDESTQLKPPAPPSLNVAPKTMIREEAPARPAAALPSSSARSDT